MANHDEAILRRRTIDPRAPFPALWQALRIALHGEYAARAFHARMGEAFGPRPPFPRLAQSAAKRIAALSALCKCYGIPRPIDTFAAGTTLAPGWLANCRRALAGEITAARTYGGLLAQVPEADARRLFARLQAQCLEEHLPGLQQAAAEAEALERYHAARGIPPEAAYASHGPVADFIERLLAQAGPLRLASPLVRHLHPAMLAGMAAGAAGVYLVKEKSRRYGKEN